MNTCLNVKPVILCGGSGTRLWPLSRTDFPKQFLNLYGKDSLLQQSVARLDALDTSDIKLKDILLIANEEHRFLLSEQLREISKTATLFLEPLSRNTAPALTLAALQAIEDDDPILLVVPSDQIIINHEAYIKALQSGIRAAKDNAIIVLGVKPNKPETGFGYIKAIGESGSNNEFEVTQFTEKPDLETAKKYFESGDFFWNSGIFIVRASVWLNAIKIFNNDILISVKRAFDKRVLDQNFVRPDRELFSVVPSNSIDYAVLEKCPKSFLPTKMILLDAGWKDLGSWEALWQASTRDQYGNVCIGDTIVKDTNNSLFYSNNRLIAAFGVTDLIVIETVDALLVVNKKNSQDIKRIVSCLETSGRKEKFLNRKVFRPWGWYDTIDIGKQFKVKRIQVNARASLSLQKHKQRAEHWVVVKGVAEIVCGDKKMTLKENESTYIAKGELHRLSNPTDSTLEIIEVQTGAYLEESDIERFEDKYGR